MRGVLLVVDVFLRTISSDNIALARDSSSRDHAHRPCTPGPCHSMLGSQAPFPIPNLDTFPRNGHSDMAPIRRYLRITKHSVLEVRIYLDRPSDAEGWLLRRDNPALPRVIQAIRPLVLPKLREENERVKGRGGSKARKKGVKDVVAEGKLHDLLDVQFHETCSNRAKSYSDC